VVAGWTGFSGNNNGDVTGTHGDYDVWIAKLSANARITSTQNIPVQNNLQLTLSPNPARNFLQLNISSDKASALLQIINATGNIVQQQNISINKKQMVQLDISKLQPGVYTAAIIAGNDKASSHFMKE
jgi:hypothetical protein